MDANLKPLDEQVIVITGASSGIGLATAQAAAQAGAKLVLAARSEARLGEIVQAIASEGGEAIYVVADVGREDDVRRIAGAAIERFGRIDTWVNDAGVAIYGRLEEVSDADNRRLFDTNFWGVVYGSLVALPHLRQNGGALINVGSEVSDAVIPLQGMYSASKHAVLGYTDALRMELEHDGLPIHVTLVKPASINTPFIEHARNYMPEAPTFPPPVYAPDVVARAILRCAERRVREITVGGSGRMIAAIGRLAPRTTDVLMERTLYDQQKDKTGKIQSLDSLYRPTRDGLSSGPYDGHVRRTSLSTRTALSTVTRALPFIAAGAVIAAGARWNTE